MNLPFLLKKGNSSTRYISVPHQHRCNHETNTKTSQVQNNNLKITRNIVPLGVWTNNTLRSRRWGGDRHYHTISTVQLFLFNSAILRWFRTDSRNLFAAVITEQKQSNIDLQNPFFLNIKFFKVIPLLFLLHMNDNTPPQYLSKHTKNIFYPQYFGLKPNITCEWRNIAKYAQSLPRFC